MDEPTIDNVDLVDAYQMAVIMLAHLQRMIGGTAAAHALGMTPQQYADTKRLLAGSGRYLCRRLERARADQRPRVAG